MIMSGPGIHEPVVLLYSLCVQCVSVFAILCGLGTCTDAYLFLEKSGPDVSHRRPPSLFLSSPKSICPQT